MKQKVFAVLVLLFMSVSALVFATVVKPVNIEQLVGVSHYIFKATVTAKQTDLDLEESQKLVTYYSLQVHEWIKGKSWSGTDEIVFKQLAQGNFQVDGRMIRQQMFFPEYEVGKTYLFFLPEAHSKSGLLAPIALHQGVYEVVVDQKGNEELPQLKKRFRHLNNNLKNTQHRTLIKSQIKDLQDRGDRSYKSFTNMVRSVMESS